MIEIKLMFVEDDDYLRDTLTRTLKREISTVKSYALPSDALNDTDNFQPDIILTDIKMPGMSGLEMVKIIRKVFPKIPVIIASAFNDANYLQTAIKLKVENYIIKPINVEQLLSTIQEITDQLKIEKSLREKSSLLEQYQHIVDISSNIVITNKSGKITYVNDKFCELSGYSREELLQRSFKKMRSDAMSHTFYEDLWKTILSKKVWKGIIQNKHKDGSTFYAETMISPILDAHGDIKEFIAIKIDITDLITSKNRLATDIITDRLTQLPNRIKLQDDFHLQNDYTMMLLDIDHFKELNLIFGIHVGDITLQFFAQSLLEVFHDIPIIGIYRVASDEFIILAQGDKRETFKELAHKLKSDIENAPLEHDNVMLELEFTATYLYTDLTNISPIEELQGAISKAKREKKFILEHDSLAVLQAEYSKNFQWTKDIKLALNDRRIILHYQPLYDMNKNEITKFESLVRFVDLEGNIVAPYEFLQAAMRSRHYRELTAVVIRTACKTFTDTDYSFSINLSIKDLTDEETFEYLLKMVKQYKVQNKIIVEVLESEGIDNFNIILDIFKRLTDEGIRIAIDDFGSGYSNFAYLVNLPVNFLKIDGSLIRNIVNDPSAKIIVQSIVMFAHELGVEIIAEFVSDKDTFEFIKSLNIDFAQGYYLGRPEEKLQYKPLYKNEV